MVVGGIGYGESPAVSTPMRDVVCRIGMEVHNLRPTAENSTDPADRGRPCPRGSILGGSWWSVQPSS